MTDKIQAIRGMNDVLPESIPAWRKIELTFENCLSRYGYQEIRFPLIENTSLFKRTIGEVTDIVEKEMYTFDDRNGESITLRPEGTAGCVRACLENGLLHNQQQKLWYFGPMFRYEKPQKGRYRQFTQFGVEAFGFAGVAIELELLAICYRLWKELGLSDAIHLQINTLGELSERQTYRDCLVEYFKKNIVQLDEDSHRRLEKNPLRILDSKNPELQTLISNAPKLIDVIGQESKQQFNDLCEGLNSLGIEYTINPSLVRGLDYYGGVVFEWVTEHLGSQSTVCAGGRFDKLVEQFGGTATPAIGFGIGAERLLLLMECVGNNLSKPKLPLAYLMATSVGGLNRCLQLSEELRNTFPESIIIVNTVGGSFKSQFKKADKSGAHFALVLGDDELKDNQISIKDLRTTSEQLSLPQSQLIEYLSVKLEK